MNAATRNALILASASRHRAAILRDAGIAFTAEPASIDERAVEAPLLGADVDPAGVAEILARAKAGSVSARHPQAHVVGADQTLSLGDAILHKPASLEEARRRLLALSGRTHHLNTAVCLVRDDETLWSHVEICHVRFRQLDPGFVGRHLAAVGAAALESVGAYQIEGPGSQLVESVEGDFFSIVGLPLLPLLAQLRRLDLIDH